MVDKARSSTAPYITQRHHDTLIAVHVQPRARRSELTGIHDGRLKIRISSPPVDGKASDALCRYLADLLSISPNRVSIESGHSSRLKRVHIRNITGATIEEHIANRLSAPPHNTASPS